VDVEAVPEGLLEVLGHVVDGVEAQQVDEDERRHRHDVLGGDGLVDRLDREPALLLRAPDLAGARVEDPVDDEARRVGADDRLLLDRLGEVEDRRRGLVGGVLAADDLDQRHDRRRVEVVEADDLLRPQRRLADLGDRKRRRVGGEDRPAGRRGVELGEDGLLDLHALGHGFDDEIDVTEPVVGRRAGDPAHELVDGGRSLLVGELALLDQAGDLALGHRAGFGEPRVDELLLDVLEDDIDSGGGDGLGDLPAHGARAHHGSFEYEHMPRTL
jgi:hypothetical protein